MYEDFDSLGEVNGISNITVDSIRTLVPFLMECIEIF